VTENSKCPENVFVKQKSRRRRGLSARHSLLSHCSHGGHSFQPRRFVNDALLRAAYGGRP
jgi:hypothetical protein